MAWEGKLLQYADSTSVLELLVTNRVNREKSSENIYPLFEIESVSTEVWFLNEGAQARFTFEYGSKIS